MEFLHFLTSFSAKLNVLGLSKLESDLRKLFLDHAEQNWHFTRYKVQQILMEINNSPIYHLQSSTTQNSHKQQQQPTSQGAFRGQGRGRGRGRGAGHGAPSSTAPIQCCIKWNKGTCTWGTHCNRAHLCLNCGDPTHTVAACTRLGNNTSTGTAMVTK